MTFALDPELPQGLLSNLIVADIAPSKGDLSPEFTGYVQGMQKIEKSKVSSRKEAQDMLSEYEPVRCLYHEPRCRSPNFFESGSVHPSILTDKHITTH